MACQCNKHSKITERVYEGTVIVDSNRVEEDFPVVTGLATYVVLCSPSSVRCHGLAAEGTLVVLAVEQKWSGCS
jgi:hypothetical protein